MSGKEFRLSVLYHDINVCAAALQNYQALSEEGRQQEV
jgi:hypothetical protein